MKMPCIPKPMEAANSSKTIQAHEPEHDRINNGSRQSAAKNPHMPQRIARPELCRLACAAKHEPELPQVAAQEGLRRLAAVPAVGCRTLQKAAPSVTFAPAL